MVDLQEKKFVQLADLDLPEVVYSSEADASQLLGITDRSNRIEMQWQGDTKKDVYSVNASTGNRKLIKKNLEGDPQISPFGNYIYWYDLQQKHYFAYTNDKVVNISSHMPHKLYDEEYDMPSQPTPYGIMAWGNLDSSIYYIIFSSFYHFFYMFIVNINDINDKCCTNGSCKFFIHQFI